MFGGGGISNKTSRLYRSLVEKELAVSVSGGLSATADPFLYSIVITVHPKRKPEEALAAFDDEIKRIQNERTPNCRDHSRHQTGARPVCLWLGKHYQPGFLAGSCRDVRNI